MLKEKGDFTAPEIQRNIETYGVDVDGIVTHNRLQWVYLGSDVQIVNWPERERGSFDQVEFLCQDQTYAVIYKPMNLVVEPGAGHKTNNLTTWIREKYPSSNFELVHRLDKDTQGIMLVAKGQENKEFFQDQFRSHSITKKYLAVVDGRVEQGYKAQHFQSRSHTHPTKQILFWDEVKALEYDERSRNAESFIRPICISDELNQTLIEIKIETGRMHQIRLLCEALGFPLVADKVYNRKPSVAFISSENVHTYFQTQIPQFSTSEFNNLKLNIFGDTEYCLLSNFLKITTPSEEVLDVQWKDIDALLG
jgi:23S rRNA pseudouridine1911/1915/1917 synthase